MPPKKDKVDALPPLKNKAKRIVKRELNRYYIAPDDAQVSQLAECLYRTCRGGRKMFVLEVKDDMGEVQRRIILERGNITYGRRRDIELLGT